MKSVLNSSHQSNVPLDLGEHVFISGVNSTVESLSLTILQRNVLLSGDVVMRVLPITTALGITTVSQTSTIDCSSHLAGSIVHKIIYIK